MLSGKLGGATQGGNLLYVTPLSVCDRQGLGIKSATGLLPRIWASRIGARKRQRFQE